MICTILGGFEQRIEQRRNFTNGNGRIIPNTLPTADYTFFPSIIHYKVFILVIQKTNCLNVVIILNILFMGAIEK